VNYFLIDRKVYFVDLPGYGFARVSQTERQRWAELMEDYFSDPRRVSLGVMLVDSRHKPTADDVTMAEWFKASGMPLVIVANKCDKLKKSEVEPSLSLIRETLSLSEGVPLIPFSAQSGAGRDALMTEIIRYL
jgi:GTP-binding protein